MICRFGPIIVENIWSFHVWVFFLFLQPRSPVGARPEGCLPFENQSSDELLLTHGIKRSQLCKAAEDAARSFLLDKKKKKAEVLISSPVIYKKMSPRASTAERDCMNIRKPIRLTEFWICELSERLVVSGSLDAGLGCD